jgi:hypothetical protein
VAGGEISPPGSHSNSGDWRILQYLPEAIREFCSQFHERCGTGFDICRPLCFRAEKARKCERERGNENDTLAKADRLIPGMDKQEALNPASALTTCED